MFNGNKHRIEKNEHDDDPVERLTLHQMAHANPKPQCPEISDWFSNHDSYYHSWLLYRLISLKICLLRF